MADSADLKHMIMSFRVSELQVLLGFAGRNKSGRKQELLQRALQLVQKGCTMPVQIKIRELYRQIFSSNLHRRRYPGGPGTSPPQVRPQTDAPPPSGALGTCYGTYTSDPAGPIDFSNKHLSSSHPDPTPSGLPVHPDVRFKHLPFYDVLAELMKPTSLVPKNNGRFQESFFVFHLTPQQAQDIAMSRDFRPGAKCEYTVQVQLRFCLLETSCEQEDNFPPSICVRVNGKMAPLPNPIPTSKPGIEPKRPGRSVDITSICRLSPTVSNQLDVSWASEFGRGYCLAIYLVRRLTSDILLQRLKQFGNRHPDHTRALIKEKLAHDPDSEIATTSLRVSLICPLGKMRMQIPCRASTCTHLQCFDATTFLMMNEKKPTWVCPVCDKPAPFDKLLIDGYFVEIFRKSPEGSEIQFHEDGSWSPMKHSKETHVISSPSVKATSSSSSAASASTSTSSDKGSSKKKSVEIIDLTIDSSDEESSPPASVSSSRPSEQGTPSTSPSLSNTSTPNNLGSPSHIGSPRILESPRGLCSPPLSSPKLDTLCRLRSQSHLSSASLFDYQSRLRSPNNIASPPKVESRLQSPINFGATVKHESRESLSPCKRESPTKISSPPAKQRSPVPRPLPTHLQTSKMYPPFGYVHPMMTSPLSMMAAVPMSSCLTLPRPAPLSLASSLNRNGVSNFHPFANVPSFDDDLLPILASDDEVGIPDFLSQSTSMLNFRPPSSTSSSQHTFNLYSDVISLD
ncbi:E3 SUMO-protein ligase PIAS2-like isoform X1 [Haliotis rufescens]|uniref:E3 SUMO-protein ligase PIAS2-like isoform X1 n=1 Tax=Haliotis rufescens TaxID=6454 RepID=UPI001EAFE629|nr:E3 SUMO-protein ligase PIAS2-like isoform X1 [Haliotis rufescens]